MPDGWVTFEQRPKGSEEGAVGRYLRKRLAVRGNGECKGPGASVPGVFEPSKKAMRLELWSEARAVGGSDRGEEEGGWDRPGHTGRPEQTHPRI